MDNVLKQDIRGLDELLAAITIAQQLAEQVEINITHINKVDIQEIVEEMAYQNGGMISLEMSKSSHKAEEFLRSVFELTQQVLGIDNENVEDLALANGGTELRTSIIVKALRG